MDVTNENFKELLPVILQQIESADFLSIDGEFTGLSDGRRINAFDTPAEYYNTVRSGSMDFLLVQFGLCIFKWHENIQAFKHSGFNFYLFPATKNTQEKIFHCQSSSIKFLAEKKFDFNKLFYYGIPYLSTVEEFKLKEQIEKRHLQDLELRKSSLQSKQDSFIPVPEDVKLQITEICDEVKMFIQDQSKDSLEINAANGFIRKLLYQEFETQFLNEIIVETVVNENNKSVLKVMKARSNEELKELLDKKHLRDWENLANTIGFSHIVRKISESGKLMVGHCLILDLLHILHQFFAPLPENYQAFKDFTNSTFPSILDTMFIASLPEFKSKLTSVNLENLFNTLSSEPFGLPSLVAENSDHLKGYSLQDEKYHEAGFDAFTTGLCFLSMADHLAKGSNIAIGEHILNSESKLLKPYINKVYLFKTSLQDSPFIYLGGKEAIPSRSHVFHLTFPKTWKRSDVNKLFSPFGGIFVSFIDDHSAFVSLHKRNLATKVLKLLRKKNKLYKITSYEEYRCKNSNTPTSPHKNTDHQQENPYKYQKSSVSFMDGTVCGIPERSDEMTNEDIGEPVTRDSLTINVVTEDETVLRRRRTVSANSPVARHVPKRRRTTSGDFEIIPSTMVRPVEPIKEEDKNKLFKENDDWE